MLGIPVYVSSLVVRVSVLVRIAPTVARLATLPPPGTRDPSLRQQFQDRQQAGSSGSSAVALSDQDILGVFVVCSLLQTLPRRALLVLCWLFGTCATTTFYTVSTEVLSIYQRFAAMVRTRIPPPFACSVLILLVSISLSTFVVSLLRRAPSLSFLVLARMLKMASPSLAMAEEIAALERTGTWDLVSPLLVFVLSREHGRDYDETFAPVAHMTTVRTLLPVRRWSVSQLDVQNAFLNGELSEEVYMQPPPGYSVPDGMVCRLRRSLYGLKQAPRAWFERFASVVTAAGFSPSLHDPALFVHTSPRGRTLLLLYVDDMIIIGDDPEYIAFVKARLRDQFLMTDLGPLRYFLGIEVSSTSDGFSISQEKYIQDLLARAALGDERTVDTPMELNVKLRPTRYRHLVGSLVYLAVTRPDISYPVHILIWFKVLSWIRSTAGPPTVEGDFAEWWSLVVRTYSRQLRKGTSSLIMLTGWWIWKHKNVAVFDNVCPSVTSLLSDIKAEARQWANASARGLRQLLP
ncbi:hypothetical protein QYE76_029434 [Lolium multiflorum]|uniref:Reverse transcriptase Ty1/copia-type domain-containing protein n=1 Tax=Lolium multiflorum TaxID=4521 RepID=A0AAD8QMU1_LOLMU|nr:hypothetical protein QYE76_029434 [Lolium multiflorum]